jgi:molybdopterin-guanine dinucleotide biosynthesis protein A
MGMAKRAAIILSGGRSGRFQNSQEMWQDKALVELFGKPLLIHAVKNVCEVVEEVVICVNNEQRRAKYSEMLNRHRIRNIRLLVDEQTDSLSGPIVGILTGLTGTKSDFCLTLPSDMPLMQPKVIEHMFNSAEDALVVVPMWPNGRLETLNMVLKRTDALEITKTLCQLRRPRSDDIIRGALKVLLISIISELEAFDPELKSFININSQADLVQLEPRQAQGPVTESFQLNLGDPPIPELRRIQNSAALFNKDRFLQASKTFSSCATRLETENSFFWAAISRENEGKSLLNLAKQSSNQDFATKQEFRGKEALLRAAIYYNMEAKVYEKARSNFLAKRATSNKEWCESLINDKRGQRSFCPQNSL